MSTTAKQVISRASRLAKVLAEGEVLTDDQQTTYLAILNEMLDSWKNKNIDFGLDALKIDDIIYVENSDLLSIRYNFAVLIADDAGTSISPLTLSIAQDTYKDLLSKFMVLEPMNIPAALNYKSKYYGYNINEG